MLGDCIQHRPAQPELHRDVDAVLDVGEDDARRKLRRQPVVHVAAFLIFREVARSAHLADVVVERHDATLQAVGADRVGGGLGQIAHHHRMEIGAGRVQGQLLQQGIVRGSHFHQPHIGGLVEDVFQERHEPERRERQQDAAD